jgi:rhodanese-related sulfurtransferase
MLTTSPTDRILRFIVRPLAAAAMALSCGTALAVTKVSPADAAKMVKSGDAILLDVREAEEVKYGVAEPAKWVPTSDIEAQGGKYKDTLAHLDKSKEVIVYCASGGRAQAFAEKLEAMGYKTANMGGYDAWKKAGLPVRKVP